jgi:hypothetical protein
LAQGINMLPSDIMVRHESVSEPAAAKTGDPEKTSPKIIKETTINFFSIFLSLL